MIRALAFALVLVATPVAASPPDFVALEDRLSAALSAYDARAVDALWDDRLIFVFPNGQIANKAERLAGLVPPKSSPARPLIAVNDAVEVRYSDKRSAVVLVRSSWWQGNEPIGKFVATHVWVKHKQGWKLVAAQVAEAVSKP